MAMLVVIEMTSGALSAPGLRHCFPDRQRSRRLAVGYTLEKILKTYALPLLRAKPDD